MKVDKLTIERVFDPTERLEAPLFQRPYVWEQEENWVPLWESIQSMAERRLLKQARRPHFLGAVVLDQLTTPTGKVHARQIIDGQQRLSTLQVSLAAARDLSDAAGQTRYKAAFQRLTLNDIPLSEDADEKFKVWPTNADREEFKAVMTAGNVTAVEEGRAGFKATDRLISGAYLYFYRAFNDWLGSSDGPDFVKRLDVLYSSLREDLHVVAIDLEADDDAQEIFETLNNLGTPLLTADLVKNYLFRRAAGEGADTVKLNRQLWSTYDEGKSYWREPVRQGRLKRPRVDLFLQHFLTLSLADEIVTTQLFSYFKDFVKCYADKSAADLMAVFRTYSDVYRAFDSAPDGSREKLFFYRLEQLDTQTIYPLLLEVFHRLAGPQHVDEREKVMTDLESFFVRRSICRFTSKNYNKLVVDLIKTLRAKHDFSSGAIRAYLLEQTAETSRWPDDAELSAHWKSVEFYRRIKRSIVRMILESIDRGLQTSKSEPIEIKTKLTIEHLMPQEWERHWPIVLNGEGGHVLNQAEAAAAAEAAKKRRNELIHTIGNLTLLTKELNPAVSNGPWDKKHKEIMRHGAIAMNRALQDSISWDETSIQNRTDEFFDVFIQIWPRASALTASAT
jgi:hypothetical protein